MPFSDILLDNLTKLYFLTLLHEMIQLCSYLKGQALLFSEEGH